VDQPDSNGSGQGVVAGLVAYLIWGVLPVYFKLTEDVDVLEVLAHRIVWAVPFGALILFARKQWPEVRKALRNLRSLAWLMLAALLIAVNWLIYIYAVQHDQVFQASLGYYINPLMYVAIGVVFLGEPLRRLQRLSILLATVGVLVLTVSYGALPWIALSLGVTFTAYGVIRKQIAVGAMPGLFVETLVLLPAAAVWLLWVDSLGTGSFANLSVGTDLLLMMAGPLTVVPLLCFAIAARKLTLTAIGFMQFIAPTLQFLVGLYYGEVLTTAHIVCFVFIWLAVGLFSYDVLNANRRLRSGSGPARA